MKVIVGNVKSKLIVGGSDNMLPIDLHKEIRKYLRIKPKGYNYSPRYKKRQWDGYKYFITPKGFFATGFLPMVCDFAIKQGAEVEIIDERENIPKLKPVDQRTNLVGVIDGEEWRAVGKFDYQFEQLSSIDNKIKIGDKMYEFPRGILDCATNAGKTSMVALIENNLAEDYNSIFIVSSKIIYKQAVEFFTKVFGYEVGEIRSGKFEFKKFTVAMQRTLLNQAKKSINVKNTLSNIDVLYVDECDEVGAKGYSATMQMIKAPMRIFVSGTPLDGSNTQNMTTIGLSGKVLYKITNDELIKRKVSQKPIITMLLNKTKSHIKTYSSQLLELIHQSKERVELIKSVVEKHKQEQILITFTEIAHGEFMYDYLHDLYGDKVVIAHGTHPQREENIEKYKNGEAQILLASQILQRGANIKNIRVLVVAHGGKSTKVLKQYLGRGLRHDGVNDEVYVYDFYDYDSKALSKQSRDRIRIYKKEGFEVIETYKSRRLIPII